jgi:hypothetical protein
MSEGVGDEGQREEEEGWGEGGGRGLQSINKRGFFVLCFIKTSFPLIIVYYVVIIEVAIFN